MIDLNRPLQAVMFSGSTRDIQLIPSSMVGTVLFVMLPVSDGDAVFACNVEGKVLPRPGCPLRVQNKVRRVYVNFYDRASAEYYETAANARLAADHQICQLATLLATAVPVDLPL